MNPGELWIKLWIEANDIIGYSVTHHIIMDKKRKVSGDISTRVRVRVPPPAPQPNSLLFVFFNTISSSGVRAQVDNHSHRATLFYSSIIFNVS